MAFQPAPSLTVENARDMLAAGLQAIAGGQHVIDFSGLTQVDSAAVAVLLAWQRAARDRKIVLSFINLPDMLQSLAELYGVAGLLPTQHDVSSFLDPAVLAASPAASRTAPSSSSGRRDLPLH